MHVFVSRVRMAVVLAAAAVAAFVLMTGVASSVISRPSAGGHGRSALLRAAFRQLDGSLVVADEPVDGRLMIEGGSYPSGTAVIVSKHGKRRVTVPGCRPAAVGGGWLIVGCGSSSRGWAAYDLATEKLRVLPLAPGCEPGGCDSVLAVGRRWVAFERSSSDAHQSPQIAFENIATGRAPSATLPPRGTRFDLDAVRLLQRLCKPLTVPPAHGGYGSIAFAGRFAIAAGSGGAYLEHCGRRLHQLLTFTTPKVGCPGLVCAPASNSHEVVWQQAAGRLGVMFLPSRRRYLIDLPRKVDRAATTGGFANGDEYGLWLAGSTLYLLTRQGHVWAAPAPRLPGSGRSQRRRPNSKDRAATVTG